MAILLVVSSEERRRRLLGRGEQLTEEETKLDKSKLFQERLVVLHNVVNIPYRGCLMSVACYKARISYYGFVQTFTALCYM
jgi:hypothetical protein